MRSFDDFPEPVKIGWTFKEIVQSPRLIGAEGWRLTTETLVSSGWNKGISSLLFLPPRCMA